MGEQKLALVFATISRPHVAQRLIASVRKFFPEMPIYVADQSERTKDQEEFYLKNNCEVVWMENDIGVCASRNAAVELVKEPFFVLADDDFILSQETDFSPALRILSNDPDIGIVGGRLIDVHQVKSEFFSGNRFWELFLNYDPRNGKLIATPVHYFAPEPKTIDGTRYFECDTVMNFAVFRTSIFDETVKWDPLFKSNGEHEDFYLNLKVHGQWRVAYTPEMVARHHHPPQPSYGRLRNRNVGWELFLKKWGLRQYLEIDHGLLVKNATGQKRTPEMGYQDYYRAAALTTKLDKTAANQLLISDINNELCPTGSTISQSPKEKYLLSSKFQIDQSGSLAMQGGEWKLDARSAKPRSLPDEEFKTLVEENVRFEVSRPIRRDNEIQLYLKPRVDKVVGFGQEPSTSSNFTVLYSLVCNGEYMVFRRNALTYSQSIVLGAPNAIVISLPLQFSADLAVELSVLSGDRILFEHSDLVDFTQLEADTVTALDASSVPAKGVASQLPEHKLEIGIAS